MDSGSEDSGSEDDFQEEVQQGHFQEEEEQEQDQVYNMNTLYMRSGAYQLNVHVKPYGDCELRLPMNYRSRFAQASNNLLMVIRLELLHVDTIVISRYIFLLNNPINRNLATAEELIMFKGLGKAMLCFVLDKFIKSLDFQTNFQTDFQVQIDLKNTINIGEFDANPLSSLTLEELRSHITSTIANPLLFMENVNQLFETDDGLNHQLFETDDGLNQRFYKQYLAGKAFKYDYYTSALAFFQRCGFEIASAIRVDGSCRLQGLSSTILNACRPWRG